MNVKEHIKVVTLIYDDKDGNKKEASSIVIVDKA